VSEFVVKVPDIGEGIAEVELVAWHVQPGDQVAADQPLADLMTDKATVEIPSPLAGRVLALGGEPGAMLAVGSPLLRLDVAGLPRSDAPPPAIPAASDPGPAPAATAGRPLAAPAVRRYAQERRVALHGIAGSGPEGRILRTDIDARLAGDTTQAAPLTGLRRRIAERMTLAAAIPCFTYVEEVDVGTLEALRARLNAEHTASRGHLSLLPFLMHAVVAAIRQFPQVNAHFDPVSGTLTRHAAVHLGIATHTDAGLLVPVVRHAEGRDLWDCAAELGRLAGLARAGRLEPEALAGSTLTLSSLGALGGIVSTPILNPPEVAIVGVNRIVQRPMYRDGALLPRLMMNLSSSFDHRVVDGAVAAEFIQAVRAALECPALLFVE
jgi:2-oxoisovalerate dehydrogenase E2 component (dihydrolipoyl transacylase)